jgi:predicted peptidase
MKRELKRLNGTLKPRKRLLKRSKRLRKPSLVLAMVVLLLPRLLAAQQFPPQVGRLDTVVTKRVRAPFLLYLPPKYAGSTGSWPLLLFLHGAGERGTDLRAVRTQRLPKMAESGALPFILAAPQTAPEQVWSTDVLLALLDQLQQKLRIDPGRVYLTGLSMGAFGAWDLATAAPERFAAVVVISGGGNPVNACRLRSTPVWLVHGRRDDVIPLELTELLARRLKACGTPVRLTIYPDAGHDAWDRTYAAPEFVQWLLSKRRRSESGASVKQERGPPRRRKPD